MSLEQAAIIKLQGLTKRYGTVTAVDGLDLEIYPGEVFGLLGPNGAGKTTTTLMLLGLTQPTGGQAWIDGHDCAREPLAVKQVVGFYPDLTGLENLRFTGRLNGLPPALCEERARSLLERVGLDYAAGRKTGAYSRGMKQRLGIADVLMKDPKVIILDEPTLGIDPEGMRELIALIRELSVRDGRTILISSHQLYQIQQICDRVGIFVQGRLVACGPIQALGQQLERQEEFRLELAASPSDSRLLSLVSALPGVSGLSQDADLTLHIRSTEDLRPTLVPLLLQEGYTLLQLRQQGGDLEEIYHRYFEKAGESHDPSGTPPKAGAIRTLLRRGGAKG